MCNYNQSGISHPMMKLQLLAAEYTDRKFLCSVYLQFQEDLPTIAGIISPLRWYKYQTHHAQKKKKKKRKTH
jgi:hypothetical protein